MRSMTAPKTEESGPAAETNPSLPTPKDVYAAVERLEQVLVRFESLVPTAEKLTLILNDQMDDALELCMRLEAVCDALSRKLFEKAIHKWVDGRGAYRRLSPVPGTTRASRRGQRIRGHASQRG